jgi:flagellar motor protein MotB
MKVAVRMTERVGKALLGVGIERVRVDGHTDAPRIAGSPSALAPTNRQAALGELDMRTR